MQSQGPQQKQKTGTNQPQNETFSVEDDLAGLRDDFQRIGTFSLPFIDDGYVMDEGDAEMVMKSIRAIQGEQKFIKNQYESMKNDLDSAEKRIFRIFASFLEDLAHRLINANGGKKKSIKLPWGTLGFRKGQDRIEILDEAAFIEMVKSDPELSMSDILSYKASISKTQLMEKFKADGEIPDHCEFIEATDKFFCN